MGWTNEQVEDLKRLWSEGLTTGEIGRVLGVSKNAVVGKAHRLELDSRPSPIRRNEDDSAAQKAKQSLNKGETKSSDAKKSSKKSEPVKIKLFTVNDLTAATCRWPIGDPKDPDFHFCGKQSIQGKPYCCEHAQTAYVIAKSMR